MLLFLALSLSAVINVHEPRSAATNIVVVPDVTHLTLNSARDVLAASGLTLGNVTLDAEAGGATQVAGQSPVPGGTAPAGSDVAVVLASLRVTTRVETPVPSRNPIWAWVIGTLVVLATSAGRAAVGIPHIGMQSARRSP
jgi:beta-lactam-binding protein with PASTA domain